MVVRNESQILGRSMTSFSISDAPEKMVERVDARHLFDSFAYTLWPVSWGGATCSRWKVAAARTRWGLPLGSCPRAMKGWTFAARRARHDPTLRGHSHHRHHPCPG